jgi:hypothetical protein
MKKTVFLDVAPSLAPAHAGSLADFFFSSTLKMEAIRSSETSGNNIYTAPHPRRLISLFSLHLLSVL